MPLPLEINQSPDVIDEPKSTAYTPSDEEAEDLKIVTAYFERSKKWRSKYDKDWDKQQSYYDGNQWVGRKRASLLPSPNVNIIRPTVETIIPILTDTSPGFDFQPMEPSDFDFADMMSKANKSWWNTSSMAHTLVETLYDQEIKDVGILKVIWNEEAKEGMGDIECYVPDPKNIFPAPNAIDFNKKCPYVTELIPDKTVGELKRKFPDKAEFIKPTGSGEKTLANTTDEIILTSPVDKKSTLDPASMVDVQGGSDEDKGITIAETWLDDYSIEEFAEEDDQGVITKTIKRKFPNGKLVTWIPDLKVILQSVPNPYKDGWKPYIRFIDTLVPRSFYGVGAVKPQIETQDMINQTVATIMDWLKKMVNPVWIIDDDSGVDVDMITNQMGMIIVKKSNTEVRREGAPSLPAQVFGFYNTLRELDATQTGIHDITQGRKPTGITAAEAIAEMQEAAQTRIRLKERNMQVSLQQLGFLVLSRMLQYYRSPRMVRLTGKEGWPEYFEFYIQEDENGDYTPIKQQYNYDEDNKKYTPSGRWERGKPSKGLFDIEVISGTALPFMKEKRGSLARQLHQQGVIDEEELLTVLEWPRKEEVLRRMEQKAQAEMPPPQGG